MDFATAQRILTHKEKVDLYDVVPAANYLAALSLSNRTFQK